MVSESPEPDGDMASRADEMCEMCGKEPWVEFVGVGPADAQGMRQGRFVCAKCTPAPVVIDLMDALKASLAKRKANE